MAIDLKQTAIDPDNPEVPPTRNTREALRDALDDIQGNILKSHGRDHSRHLFITFKTDTAEQRKQAREWLAELVEEELVTSALQQWDEAKSYRDMQATLRANGAISVADHRALLESASEPFVGVMLSSAAYRDLKLGDDSTPDDPSFIAGAKARADFLNDPPAKDWEEKFQATLHALVIVADDVEERLEGLVKDLKLELAELGVVPAEETGAAMRLNAKGEEDPSAPVREHFGFVDGISQPLFFARDIGEARTRQGGIDEYDPSAPLDQVLVPDPGGDDDTAYGSYFVYRKLEQDVQGFREDEKALAAEIARFARPKSSEVLPEDVALAGAYMVGRFQDGTPVVDREVAGLGDLPNNFSYDADVDGVRCPFTAHVRKTNPRGDKQRQFGTPLTQERAQRIARRGISFGKVTLKPGRDDKVGLLFLCAQSSIADQFEFIQAAWSNNEVFLRGGSGLDPVIGTLKDGKKREEAVEQRWPKQYGARNELDFSRFPPPVVDFFFKKRVGQWTFMRGGEYFFVPSLSALKAFGELVEA
ncbi:Dyp-type peroxidase [Streptomyces sp. NBC_01235]|uniref:Dyp-type peroxidase n=1 Tax=Streptomyces sp. NBC_01235 TaxID=2903788 RepID=UPI002E0E981C|nr:Dyp-type peroxidase [Streptomyces sp. NBC_01235]